MRKFLRLRRISDESRMTKSFHLSYIEVNLEKYKLVVRSF